MKKLALILLILTISYSSSVQAQNRQSIDAEKAAKYAENSTTVFIQIIAEEEFNSPEVKMRAILGKDNQFYIKDKRDFEIYDVIQGEISKLSLIPDALNYLGEKGFVIEMYSSNTIGDRLRHTILLSRTTVY